MDHVTWSSFLSLNIKISSNLFFLQFLNFNQIRISRPNKLVTPNLTKSDDISEWSNSGIRKKVYFKIIFQTKKSKNLKMKIIEFYLNWNFYWKNHTPWRRLFLLYKIWLPKWFSCTAIFISFQILGM